MSESPPPEFKPDLFVLVLWDESGLEALLGCDCCDLVMSFETALFGRNETIRFIRTRPLKWFPRPPSGGLL